MDVFRQLTQIATWTVASLCARSIGAPVTVAAEQISRLDTSAGILETHDAMGSGLWSVRDVWHPLHRSLLGGNVILSDVYVSIDHVYPSTKNPQLVHLFIDGRERLLL